MSNDRGIVLMKQAVTFAYSKADRDLYPAAWDACMIGTLIELVVKDCAEVVEDCTFNLHSSEFTAKNLGRMIKEHFGVE